MSDEAKAAFEKNYNALEDAEKVIKSKEQVIKVKENLITLLENSLSQAKKANDELSQRLEAAEKAIDEIANDDWHDEYMVCGGYSRIIEAAREYQRKYKEK